MKEEYFSDRRGVDGLRLSQGRKGEMREQKIRRFESFSSDRVCTSEEWLRLLAVIILSPTTPIKIIRVEKRTGGSYVPKA